jgi:hypothetical protein
MKVTIEVPDELYRRVKSQAALTGRSVREVTTELYQHWLGDTPPDQRAPSAAAWLEEWVALGHEALQGANPATTASDILAADRARLDSR